VNERSARLRRAAYTVLRHGRIRPPRSVDGCSTAASFSERKASGSEITRPWRYIKRLSRRSSPVVPVTAQIVDPCVCEQASDLPEPAAYRRVKPGQGARAMTQPPVHAITLFTRAIIGPIHVFLLRPAIAQRVLLLTRFAAASPMPLAPVTTVLFLRVSSC